MGVRRGTQGQGGCYDLAERAPQCNSGGMDRESGLICEIIKMENR